MRIFTRGRIALLSGAAAAGLVGGPQAPAYAHEIISGPGEAAIWNAEPGGLGEPGDAVEVAAGAPSEAADVDCPASGFCLYFNSELHGAFWWTTSSEPNLDPFVFLVGDESSGAGLPVKNNAASVWNRTDSTWRVYFNSGYRGVFDSVEPVSWRNLVNTKNENASLLRML